MASQKSPFPAPTKSQVAVFPKESPFLAPQKSLFLAAETPYPWLLTLAINPVDGLGHTPNLRNR